ncbi:anti-sigma factor family protein [Bacillus sp. FJAT-45037]|uniref:anti-sigma factor family protein n=1 Tax=Bacillus sp. FJAT-45037 TaxID=2011007 RepID=UPI000C23E6C0|nr:anti-sigma factor [Bacillus sp. FJAT-45037]
MKCEQRYSSLIHKYLDGEVTKSEKNQLEAHLLTCEDCLLHVRELKKAIAFVQSTSHIEAPNNFTNQVMANLPKKDAPSKTKSKWKRWTRQHPILVAAAVFILLMSTSISSLWQNNTDQVSFTGSGNVQIDQGSKRVIVPEGEIIEGDMTVRNGELVIHGEVRGNILLVNSEPYLASAGHVSGEIEEVNQVLDWIWYHTKNFFSEVVSVLDDNK